MDLSLVISLRNLLHFARSSFCGVQGDFHLIVSPTTPQISWIETIATYAWKHSKIYSNPTVFVSGKEL